MTQEEALTQYVLEKYKPRAILLHGSRASGYARAHSDWDIAILVDNDVVGEREIIDGANIEIRVLKLPFDSDNIGDKWLVFREGNVKVLYDPEQLCGSIIEKVTVYYNTPMIFESSEITGHQAWYRSHLDGMIDYKDDQQAFFRKLGELYNRSIQYWFHFLHHMYMPQVYLSLPKIEQEDPEYYELLKILAGTYSNEEKIQAGEKVYRKIWK